MPRGDKSAYTEKQKRQAVHIEEGYVKKGVSTQEAESRAWATVNKESGGGKQSGAGRAKESASTPAKKSLNKPARTRTTAEEARPSKKLKPVHTTPTVEVDAGTP